MFDCYALIVVGSNKCSYDALKIYVDKVSNEYSLTDLVINSLYPIEISRNEAFLKFLTSTGVRNQIVEDAIGLFGDAIDTVLLIDHALI